LRSRLQPIFRVGFRKNPLSIRFDISKKVPWNPETNKFETRAVRSADCYVFCLYPETDPDRVNVLDVRGWEFYVVPPELIDQEFGDQKSVGITRIQALCKPVDYGGLKESIDKALSIK